MFIIFVLIILLLAIGLLLWQISNIISMIFGSPPVMVKSKIIGDTLRISGLKKGDVFYDLGSGNGEVLIAAAKMGAKAVGYEISPWNYLVSKIRTLRSRQIKIQYQSFFHADLSKADIIYVYLFPGLLKKLAPKLKKELQSSARVISVAFPIAGLKLIKKEIIASTPVFLYRKI